MTKIHARITREIEVTDEELDILEKASNQLLDDKEMEIFRDICRRFGESKTSGSYGDSYIPEPWIIEDDWIGHGFTECKRFYGGNINLEIFN